SPAAAPQTRAASSIAGEPIRVAIRRPAARSRAGRSTYRPAAAVIAASTSGGIRLPPRTVFVPSALITRPRPSASYGCTDHSFRDADGGGVGARGGEQLVHQPAGDAVVAPRAVRQHRLDEQPAVPAQRRLHRHLDDAQAPLEEGPQGGGERRHLERAEAG